MRLLTHNTLRNNAAAAKGKGFPLQIIATEIKVEDDLPSGGANPDPQQLAFIKAFLPRLDWPALVQAATEMGIPTLPTKLSQELADNETFLYALYHVLMNVHLVQGTLKCPATGREFPVRDGIPNMMLEEEECENVRF